LFLKSFNIDVWILLIGTVATFIVGILIAFISGILFLSVDALIEIYDDLKVQQISKN